MADYVMLSLETHLFFARIMKEHSLFLEAGFPCKEKEWIQKADWFKKQFEEILCQVIKLGDGRVGYAILKSGELTTEFTLDAEKKTERLSGISINTELTAAEEKLRAGCRGEDRELNRKIYMLNEQTISLISGLIDFKEAILRKMKAGQIFNANYPLLISHIIREAKLYRATLEQLQKNRCLCRRSIKEMEEFWNRIMMEHALFIRGLLDPSEEALICTANEFAGDFEELLEMSNCQNMRASDQLTRKSLEETIKLRDFKAAGAEGILDNKIASIILPLLADHVLREANHYIRILRCQS